MLTLAVLNSVVDLRLNLTTWGFCRCRLKNERNSTRKVAATEFKPEFQADRLEEIDSLKKSLKSDKLKVVDTRSDSEFADGRIPGSAHLEWKELVAEDGRFKTKPQLRELFRKKGIMPSETAVCY